MLLDPDAEYKELLAQIFRANHTFETRQDMLLCAILKHLIQLRHELGDER